MAVGCYGLIKRKIASRGSTKENVVTQEAMDKAKLPTIPVSTSVAAQARIDAHREMMIEQGAQALLIEQLRTQLAGCAVAALGGTQNVAKKGDYGWSQSYQDVLDLRIKFESLQAENVLLRDRCMLADG